jgi:hypothetical protein
MKAVMHVALVSALLCTSMYVSVYAQEQSSRGVQIKKQTADSAPQTVVETPKTRKAERKQHLTDGTNTTRNQKPASGPRDSYGVPVPEPIQGQGTNGSTDTMRAADKKH